MTLEQAVYNRLSTYQGLLDILGLTIGTSDDLTLITSDGYSLVSSVAPSNGTVFPVKLPQNPTLPAITFFQVSGSRIRTMGGNNLNGRPRWQVSCWARSYLAAKALADQVVLALDGFTGTLGGTGGVEVQGINLENEIDQDEPEVGFYQVILDFTIWHGGA
jgi:hypothetical protein